MHDTYKIRKGLDIPLAGMAQKCLTDAREIALYAVKPSDFVGLVPKMVVKGGELVKAGDTLFVDKNYPEVRFTSPVSGTVREVVRGDRRAVLAVTVESDGEFSSAEFAVDGASRQGVVDAMLQSGLWVMLRQRPFGIVACPTDVPKSIFVSCFDSAPLAPDYDFLLQDREADFVAGVRALALLTEGGLHLSFRPEQGLLARMEKEQLPQNVRLHAFAGVHPAGLVGTQISAIDPINAGDKVWTMDAQSVAVLGHLMQTGEYRPERIVAFAGALAGNPCYYRLMAGAQVARLTEEQMNRVVDQLPEDVYEYRLISGNVLSGTQIAADGFLGACDSLLSVLAEGSYYEFMGWLMPGFRKFSFSRTFLSGFFTQCACRKRAAQKADGKRGYRFDTNLHGEVRPLVVTGSFERLVPIDIYPMQLLKAAIIGDIELMENLGIYEVEPEDFALCEFADTSKTEIQSIIREALEKCRKEGC